MWSSLLVLALLSTINPVRLGIVLLVVCRPRPIQSLLAYWAGCVIVGLVYLVVPLMVLYATPTSASFAKKFAHPAENPTARHIAIGVGVLLLSVAALMVLRSAARQRTHLPTPGRGGGRRRRPLRYGNANTSTLVPDSNIPSAISLLFGPAQDAATEGGSAIRRLLSHARTAWENGSPWIAFVLGLVVSPPIDAVLFTLAIIVASGAAIGMQVSAAIAFIIGMLAVEEIILVTNFAAPSKTQAALRLLRGWAQAHRRMILVAVLAVVGVSLVAQGMGGL